MLSRISSDQEEGGKKAEVWGAEGCQPPPAEDEDLGTYGCLQTAGCLNPSLLPLARWEFVCLSVIEKKNEHHKTGVASGLSSVALSFQPGPGVGVCWRVWQPQPCHGSP